ncbi:MAG: ATP synthase F1 subunit delta [Ruminococcaceae bacterium]|nr:ATP synthase F1 subunit delta [Oscillospiraceae bacterium]
MTEVGTIFGGALYDLAASEDLTEEIFAQLKVLSVSFAQEPAFVKLLCAHSLPKNERCKILDDSFGGKVHPYVLNFLKILTEKGHVRYFADCCAAFRIRYNEAHNILPVTAVTAVALTQAQSARLTEKLEKLTEKKIELHNRIDAQVLGGVRLDFDGKTVDDTLANRLASISHLLNNTIL